MQEGKNKQNFPKRKKKGFGLGGDGKGGDFGVDFDDYSDYEETLAFLKTGKTPSGRRFK